MGHARALITAADPQALAAEVIRRGLSVRETERLARVDQAEGRRGGRAGAQGARRRPMPTSPRSNASSATCSG